ncbi:MAG: carboxymuconolactone decarboxylase family protein [Solirubrobacterales bacterium]
MARIEPPRRKGPLTRLVLRIAKRGSGGTLPEPFALQAHTPLLLNGYGAFEWTFMHSHRAPERLKQLAELKAAALCGCEWCMDFGSWLARSDVTEEQMRELPNFRESDAFDDDEKLVLEYAECISRTPVEVPDELFERLRARFDEPQLIELTYAAAIENMRARFNWALGITPQGYSEGAVCIRPEALPEAAKREAA